MKKVTFVAVVIAGACLVGACSKGPDTQAKAPRDSGKQVAGPASQPSRTPSAGATSPTTPAPAQTAAKPTPRRMRALVGGGGHTEITGIPIERVERTTDGCAWYANAAAQREKSTASASGTFEKMSKQEPATAEEAMRNVETMFKGFVGAASPSGPLFAVTVQSENADQAEAILKGTVAVVGAGTPGGKLEPVAGLGDRAYWGPVSSFLLVRKGPVLLNLGLSSFSGSREQAIALARRMVSRL
jgi:hypothetical protein